MANFLWIVATNMDYAENETTELKSIYVDDIKKEIIAFANTFGGTIYIGIEDDGRICGVEDADAVMQQVMKMLLAMGLSQTLRCLCTSTILILTREKPLSR